MGLGKKHGTSYLPYTVFPHAENTSFIKEKTYTSKLPKGGFSNSLSNYFQIKLLR